MKIPVNLVIELTKEDIEGLVREYGWDPANIRQHIREYLLGNAHGCPAGEFWKATLK